MKKLLIALSIITATVAAPLVATTTPAFADAKTEITNGVNSVNDGNSTDLPAFITNIVNIMLFLAGVVAVIMIIIGGIRFVVSNGDSGSVKSAKDTVLYSVIGLIVVILAYAIVNFVINSFD